MRKILLCLLTLFLILPLTVQASEAPIEIYTPEDLAAIAENPAGHYILMDDLDMSGIAWQGIDFQGILDGNGHAILNLCPTVPGTEKPLCYDGNLRKYEPEYYGLFSTLRDATITDLTLLNVATLVDTQQPAYLAALAGYADNCLIRNVTVTGTLELRAHEQLFGVSGLIGYGNGTVENCRIDVTLLCVDTDPEHRDEQFLGGIYGHGFFYVRDCNVTIDAYVSEHGYCHNGGIGGMHMRYPLTHTDTCEFARNTVTGKVTFFEHNLDRRAYCDAVVGEYLEQNYREVSNTKNFLRDERWQWDKELRPCMCENPQYLSSVTDSTCHEFGYTTLTCQSCGYSYRDAYTKKVHTPGPWQITKESTTQEQGMQAATCIHCDYLFTEVLETLPPETTEATIPPTEVPPETLPATVTEPADSSPVWIVGVCAAAAAAVLFLVLRTKKKQPKGKFQQ